MKRKHFQRWMGLLLALCLLTLPVFTGLADEWTEPEETVIPETPAPTAEPTAEPTAVPTEAPTQEPAAEPETTEAPEELPTAEPEIPQNDAKPMSDAQTEPVETQKPYAVDDGKLVVRGRMTVAQAAAAAADAGVRSIIVAEGAEIGGEGTVYLPVGNLGTISGGTFMNEVLNFGLISGGKFAGIVNNGEEQKAPSEIIDPNSYNPHPGAITGGIFGEESVLNNYWTVERAEVYGTINAYYASTMTYSVYGATAKVGDVRVGTIAVRYTANGAEQTANYGAPVLEALAQVEGAKADQPWYWYVSDPTALTAVTSEDTFGLKVLNYVQAEGKTETETPTNTPTSEPENETPVPTAVPTAKPTATAAPTPKLAPTATPKPLDTTGSGASGAGTADFGSSNTLDTSSSGGGSYSWEQSVASSYGSLSNIEQEESNVGFSPEEDLINDFLQDGARAELGILSDAEGNGAGYELISIAGGEMSEEDIGLIPGEAGGDGSVPGMVFIRAKGIGAEARTLTLTLNQLQRMASVHGAEALVFRNGAATVSLNMSTFVDGDVLKLAGLMQEWANSGANFVDCDLSEIDFSAIQEEPKFSEAELGAFQVKLTIAPTEPAGYTVNVELCLDENAKEIGQLLGRMGITLHGQTATDDVAVYYMNDAEERYLLESHKGIVPAISDTVEGYEVTCDESEYSVMTMSRTVTEDEFAGVCASTGDEGTYYIGIVPK